LAFPIFSQKMIFIPLKSVSIVWLALVLITCSHTEEPVKEPKLSRVCGFPEELKENSGMTEYADLLWNINDGGNEAAIYGFGAKDTVVHRKVIIREAVNTDWEDITQDEKHLYIGDFGNNLGDRRDLRIYILNKQDILSSSDTVPVAGTISFSYQYQTDFTPAANYTTPWDCEAFVVLGDSVILFTKDWQSNQTSLYTLPAKAGNFTAKFRKRYNISGLVTAAAWSKTKKELLVLGYQNYTPFISVVPDFGLDNLSFADIRRINFPDLIGTQTEGIAYSGDGSVYVSCEKSPLVMQTLFRAEF
jgi:hypothetical protein